MSQNKAKQPSLNETEPTNSDILGAINQFATQVEERFDKIESTMATKTDLAAAVQRIEKIEKTMVTNDELTDKLAAMETRLVTKSYLDDKLLDLKGDLIVIARKEDRKVDNVIGLLQKKNIFSAQEAADLFNPPVFAKTV